MYGSLGCYCILARNNNLRVYRFACETVNERYRVLFNGLFACCCKYLNLVELQYEHIAAVEVTESNANCLACVCSKINSRVLVVAVADCLLKELRVVRGISAGSYIYAVMLFRPIGILRTCIPAKRCARCVFRNRELRRNCPVVGIYCAKIVDERVRIDAACAFISYGCLAKLVPIPIVAVAVFIDERPLVYFTLRLEVPADEYVFIAAGCRCRIGSVAAIAYDNVYPVVLSLELYLEFVGLARFKCIVVISAGALAVVAACNPYSVAGCRVRNSPVICAGGNEYRSCVVDYDIGRCERTVGILRNLILEVVIETCRCITGVRKTTFNGDYCAVSRCIRIDEHLITAAVAPNVSGGELNKSIAFGDFGIGYRCGCG